VNGKGTFDTSVYRGYTDALSVGCSGRRWFLIGRTGPGPLGLIAVRCKVVEDWASAEEYNEQE